MVKRAVVLVALIGCGGGLDGGGPDGAAASDVVGRALVTCHQSNGDVDQAVDLSQRAVRAWVTEAGRDRAIEGAGQADGTFVIAGVPAGPYLLEVGARRFVTDQRVVELRDEHVGRCTPKPTRATEPALIELDLTETPLPFPNRRPCAGMACATRRRARRASRASTTAVDPPARWPTPARDGARRASSRSSAIRSSCSARPRTSMAWSAERLRA